MNRALVGFVLTLILAANTVMAQDYSGQNVTAVRIEGLERASDANIRSKLEVQPGQEFSPRAISRDIRRLYDLNYFSNIKADAQAETGGVAVTYIVEEKRVVHELQIIGTDKIKERRVRGVLSMREGDSFVAEAYADEREAILDLYESKSFANTTVDVVAEKVGPSRVRVIYTINEGRKARIKKIAFVGNQALGKRELKKAMDTSPARWFLGGKFEEALFEHDLRTILDAYADVGRLEADITKTDVLFTGNGKGLNITLYLEEGPEYTVEQLDVASNTVYDDDEALELIEVGTGEVHNQSQVIEDAAAVEQLYQDSGYINARVTPQITRDTEHKTTYVTHNVSEGDLKYIRQVNTSSYIQGGANDDDRLIPRYTTRDSVIRRELAVTPGDRYDGTAVDATRRRLLRAKYFDEVRVFPVPIADEGLEGDLFTDLQVDVEEGRRGNFTFGGGFSTDDGFGGFGELHLNNFDITNWPTFTGGGQEFKLRLSLGDRRTEYSLGFTDPEIFGYPLSFGFDIFDESYEASGASSYDEEERGIQLRFGKALSEYNAIRTAWRFEETVISDLPYFVNREIRRQEGSSTTFSTTYQFERNTLDSQFDSSSGAKHVFTSELAGLGGDNNFYKLQHDTTWYKSLGEETKWVLMLRTREGWVTEYGSSDFVPLQDRFYAGGTSTVRGYDNRDIGPKRSEFFHFGEEYAIGGDLRWLTTVEMKYKLTDMFRLYSFFDSGGVWEDASDFDLGDIKYSAGVGFGFNIPALGPFRVDYGFALNPDEDQGSGRLHLQTGFRF